MALLTRLAVMRDKLASLVQRHCAHANARGVLCQQLPAQSVRFAHRSRVLLPASVEQQDSTEKCEQLQIRYDAASKPSAALCALSGCQHSA